MASKQAIRVIVATESGEVPRHLETRNDVEFEIAVHTGTIKDLLPDAQLLIIDYEDLVEFGPSEADIREEIFESAIAECGSQAFLANPESFLGGEGFRDPGKMYSLPSSYCIAFVSYSGGTGRTTLAMDTALHHAEVMKKQGDGGRDGKVDSYPVLLVEFTYGVSSFISLTAVEMPTLSQLATSPDVPVHQYKGVSMLPMDYDFAQLLPSDLLRKYLQEQMDRHRLTVVDCLWPHGLSSAVKEMVNLWVIVASERSDTQVNARKLYDELCSQVPAKNVWLLLNQTSEKKAPIESEALDWNMTLPKVARADEFKGKLGRKVLLEIFSPAWQNYE